jgi:hypothetical protein
MATENLDGIYSYPAAADLSGSYGCAVSINSSGEAALAGANSAAVDGIIHSNNPALNAQGDMIRVVTLRGVTVKAKSGAAWALGALLTTDSTGRLVTATTGQNVVAKAHRFAASKANVIVEVLWYGNRGAVAP